MGTLDYMRGQADAESMAAAHQARMVAQYERRLSEWEASHQQWMDACKKAQRECEELRRKSETMRDEWAEARRESTARQHLMSAMVLEQVLLRAKAKAAGTPEQLEPSYFADPERSGFRNEFLTHFKRLFQLHPTLSETQATIVAVEIVLHVHSYSACEQVPLEFVEHLNGNFPSVWPGVREPFLRYGPSGKPREAVT